MTISMVLYGRNDNYGYNLHKRAALSLNCMAEVLTDSSDEILFVDYNTPDDFPTFPEAIQDTLTKRARALLRILRVRPDIHQRYKSKTHLMALEPIARNVAIRRSCPDNRWILSTNTDMIFVPHKSASLSKISKSLRAGFYHAPRIEIPEVLWEGLDRYAPSEVISTVRDWGRSLHLNEIVLGADFILYDGPGDFQLILRDDLFENHGFHEQMLLGWHVDSNIAKRMYLKYGTVGDLGREVYGYHCDHTRQVTPAHSHTRLQNDWRRYCDQIDRPDVPEQADSWGCVDDEVEEIRLLDDSASIYLQGLGEAIGSPLTEPMVSKYTHETYNKSDYDPRHMVPFLADMFVSMPRKSTLAWYGAGTEMLSRFATVWERLGFAGKIIVDPDIFGKNKLPELVELDATSSALEAADAFVFDFGGLPGAPHNRDRNERLSRQLLRRFLDVVRKERSRAATGLASRRVLALNAINNQFEQLVSGYLAAASTPCATHMRHGFVLPHTLKSEWLALLSLGPAGIRIADRINSAPEKLGVVAYGPHRHLEPGRYRLAIEIVLMTDESEPPANEPIIVIEVHADAEVFGVFLIRRSALADRYHQFMFEVPQGVAEKLSGIQARIMLFRHVALSITSLTLEAVPELSGQVDRKAAFFSPPIEFGIEDWLPYLSTGSLGHVGDSGTKAERGPSDFVVFGPYWPLPAGRYEMIVAIERQNELPSGKHLVRADVITGEQWLVGADIYLDALATNDARPIRLPFEMSGTSSEWRQIETRVWSSGEESFRIKSLSVKPLEQRRGLALLPFLLVGEMGRHLGNVISTIEGGGGLVAYSPTMKLRPGPYRMSFAVEMAAADALGTGTTYAIMLVKHGHEVVAAREITFSEGEIEEQELLLEVPATQDPDPGLEFFFRVMGSRRTTLRELDLEPLESTITPSAPAVLCLRNWLPFLQTGLSAAFAKDGIVVSQGCEEFAVFGPYWTLPPGRYEMRALVLPNSGEDRTGVASVEIAAEEGRRLFAQTQWRLGRYELTDPAAAVEFRLPFSLSGDLSAAARTIEARIFTRGDLSFRLLSVGVTARGEDSESNWFPYLTAGECGLHTGRKINSAKDQIGYLACTLPMTIHPGRYRALPVMEQRECTPGADTIALEAWCGSDLVAIKVTDPKSTEPLEFLVTDEFSENGIELRIRTVAPIESSISGLVVEKISDAVTSAVLPTVLTVKDWLPFLRLGPAGVRDSQGVLVKEGQSGYVVYGPYWPLASGRYVAVFVLELEQPKEAPATEQFSLLTWRPLKKKLAGRGGDVQGGADVMLDGRQIAVVEGFAGASFSSRIRRLKLPFEIAASGARIGSKLETRIWSTGRTGFRVRSVHITTSLNDDQSAISQNSCAGIR